MAAAMFPSLTKPTICHFISLKQKRPLSRSFSLPLSLEHQVLEVVVQRYGSEIIIIYAVICLHIECIFTVEADILCQNDISIGQPELAVHIKKGAGRECGVSAAAEISAGFIPYILAATLKVPGFFRL